MILAILAFPATGEEKSSSASAPAETPEVGAAKEPGPDNEQHSKEAASPSQNQAVEKQAIAVPVSSPTPPRGLRKIGNHWTPYQPPDPESFPEGAQVHIIVNGDTLWDLSAKQFQNPYLWPQIWNENRYILDSHWIYPGDPILLPPRPTVVSEIVPATGETGNPVPGNPTEPPTGEPEGGESEPAPTLPVPASPRTAEEARPEPAADHSDVYCSGEIRGNYERTDLYIANQEEESRVGLTSGDIIYINGGREGGKVRAGDSFLVIAREGEVFHPVTGKWLGTYVKRLGKVKVVAVQDQTSIAEITEVCGDRIEVGFELEADREIPVPTMREHPFNKLDVEPSGKANGYIVHLQDDMVRAPAGKMVDVDLGAKDGLKPGDLLLVYLRSVPPKGRPINYKYKWNDRLYEPIKLRDEDSNILFPRKPIGQLIVIRTEDRTSTAKVVDSIREIEVGNQVELR